MESEQAMTSLPSVAGYPATGGWPTSATVPYMRLRMLDLAALGLAAITLLLGASAWLSGGIDLGLTLTDAGGKVVVDSVVPDGLAMRAGIVRGSEVLALQPLSDAELRPTELVYNPDATAPLDTGRPALQQPKATLEEPQIEYVSAGEVFRDDQGRLVGWGGPDLYRDAATFELGSSIGLLLIGALLGLIVWGGVARGGAGDAWRCSAIPLAAAVAVPLMAVPLQLTGTPFGLIAAFVLPALALLPFAYLLCGRQPAARRGGWFMGAWLLAAAILYLTLARQVGSAPEPMSALRYLLLPTIVLVPAVAAIFSSRGQSELAGQNTSPTARSEIATMGLTPVLALAVWLPGTHGAFLLPFLLWLVIVALARHFTVAPLLRFVQRTQRQRDLVVAATEAERARLAADLHDDALQELISLVRRLDASGDTAGAELARHVAERLRAICSDLRLPLLDDLGAGAALEWLVTRVEPIAGGRVHLERIDTSRPPANVELAVFRVAQEAVSNAVRHGRTPITVRYQVTDAGRVSLSVEDAGPGIDAQQAEAAQQAGHFGLANMQQRAEQIGALLDVRRWPGGGTHVAMEWRPR